MQGPLCREGRRFVKAASGSRRGQGYGSFPRPSRRAALRGVTQCDSGLTPKRGNAVARIGARQSPRARPLGCEPSQRVAETLFEGAGGVHVGPRGNKLAGAGGRGENGNVDSLDATRRSRVCSNSGAHVAGPCINTRGLRIFDPSAAARELSRGRGFGFFKRLDPAGDFRLAPAHRPFPDAQRGGESSSPYAPVDLGLPKADDVADLCAREQSLVVHCLPPGSQSGRILRKPRGAVVSAMASVKNNIGQPVAPAEILEALDQAVQPLVPPAEDLPYPR